MKFKSKELTAYQEQNLVDEQNRIRGTISRLRARTQRRKGENRLRAFRIEITRNLLQARSALHPNQYEEYLLWLEVTISSLVPEMLTVNVDFDYLSGFVSNPTEVPLASELSWIASRLSQNADEINQFRESASKVEHFVFKEDLSNAKHSLSSLSEKHGSSFWAIQLRIALEQLDGGLEQQKSYVEGLRKTFRRGVLAFISYYTSVRNEERTSWARYIEMIDEACSSTPYDAPTKAYIRYRLTNNWPLRPREVASILRLEQSHSIVDIYETFVDLLQQIAKSEILESYRNLAGELVSKLAKIRDFRIVKIATALGVSTFVSCPPRKTSISDALISGNLKFALKQATFLSSAESIDPWQIIYHSIALAHFSEKSKERKFKNYNFIPLISSIVSRDTNCVQAINQLIKLSNNLRGIPYAVAISDFFTGIVDTSSERYFSTFAVGFNSAFRGAEDFDRIQGSASLVGLNALSPTARAWSCLAVGGPEDALEEKGGVFAFAFAVRKLRLGEPAKAIEILDDALATGVRSEALRFFIMRLILVCRIELGDREGIVRLIASEAGKNDRSAVLLPVGEALSGYSWQDYKPLADGLEVGIALDTLWRGTDDDSIATMLRFAFSYQLRRSGSSRPSYFIDEIGKYDPEALIYYLRYVCVPSVMDMSRAFNGSKDVLSERQAVYASLKIIDPANSEDYDGEIYNITNRLVISEGLKLVDSSRIHVDTDAVTRWARKNIAEDYDRYAALITAGIGVGGNFDEILREVFADIGARQVFFTPDDQSDAVLADMFNRLRSEFLNNSDYGLDYFLSKRVRHQSFIGLIRGPLEFKSLITTRESEFGAYKKNQEIIDRFRTLSADLLDQMNRALSRFAESFDDLLIEIKDKNFQIRSVDNPQGLFDLTLTQRMLFIVRSVAQGGISLDDFLRMAYLLFWGALDPSLAEARRLISNDLKVQISELFDWLKAELKEIADGDPAFPELSATIGDVAVEVQRSLDAAAAWFVRPEGQQASHNFTLRQSLDIAIESALKSHRAFEPELAVAVVGDVDLQAPDLLLLTDAIFIALDNVKAHSGIKRGAKVEITCTVDAAGDMVLLEVRNNIAPSIRTPALEAKLQSLREMIRAGGGSKGARREGGSGFLKLSASLRNSANGSLDFGVVEDDQFKVSVGLRPTKYTLAVIKV